jgi:chromosome segregation ATPase
MDYATRRELEELAANYRHLEAEVRKLKEQQTDQIRITRLEVEPSGTQEHLARIEKYLDQMKRDLDQMKHDQDQMKRDQDQMKRDQDQMKRDQDRNVLLLQEQGNVNAIQMQGVRADIANLQATQSDLQEWRKEDLAYRAMHADRLDRLSGVLDETLVFAASADKKLNHMATKEDIAAFVTKADFDHAMLEQRTLLQEVLRRLPPT